MIGDFLTISRTPDGRVREETVLDPEFGEISLELCPRVRPAPSSFGSERLSDGANNPAWRVFEANLRAALEQTATAEASPMGADDYARASIGVDSSSSNGGIVIIAAGESTWAAESNTGTVFVPPALDGSGLPVAVTWNANNSSGNFPGAPVIITSPVNSAAAPNWNGFAPAPRIGAFHERFSVAASVPSFPVLSSAPAVVSVAATMTSLVPAAVVQTVTAPSSVGVGGATLRTSALSTGASAAPASSGNVQPQLTPNSFLYVGGAGTVNEYDATTGAQITAGFTTIASPNPASLTAVAGALYVGDTTTDTVKAYNPSTGLQISPSIFTPITGVSPSAIVVSSDGQDLFVANIHGNTVQEYNAITGQLIPGGFSVSTVTPMSLTLSTDGADIYIGSATGFNVREYAIATGLQVGAFAINGVEPGGIAMSASGNQLFIADEGSNKVEEYSSSTGAPITFEFAPPPPPGEPVNVFTAGTSMYVSDIAGVDDSGPQIEFYSYSTSEAMWTGDSIGMSGLGPIAFIPEPSTGLLLLAAGAMFLAGGRRRKLGGV
jgi:DNA-binding beta-propeller fold protein YncE